MSTESAMKWIFDLKYETKEKTAGVLLLVMAAAFELLSRTSRELKEETADWENGRTFSVGVINGPIITLKYENGRIVYLGKGLSNPKFIIYFKNVDAALMVFAGMIGSHTAAVQHRTVVHGNISESLQAVRAMGIVQKYLFPGFMLGPMFKRKPGFTAGQLVLKARTLATLLPAIIRISGK